MLAIILSAAALTAQPLPEHASVSPNAIISNVPAGTGAHLPEPGGVRPARARYPVQATVSRDDYPALLEGNGPRGIVRVMLQLDTMGRVSACTITKSSGSAVLDATTCSLITRRARFDPATDQRGRAVIAHINEFVDWDSVFQSARAVRGH